MAHASFFRYHIGRPYPLRWFTPVAIVGGVVFAILISFANFVTSAYQLTPVHDRHPDTINQGLWFKHWPAWLTNNINATCQPANLAINYPFFTNQQALSYTLTNVSIEDPDGGLTPTPSLPYLNNELKHCEVLNISMDLDCSPYQNRTQLSNGKCAIDVRALAQCTIEGPNGVTIFNITSLHNPQQGQFLPGSSSFISLDVASKASLWWAQQLLKAYWFETDIALFDALITSDYNTDKGIAQRAVSFYRNEVQNNITVLSFFNVWYSFSGLEDHYYYIAWENVETLVDLDNSGDGSPPPIWAQADRLAKSMYSAVMTDLGQRHLPQSSNLVADASNLQMLTQKFAGLATMDSISGVPFMMNDIPNGTYDDLKGSIGSGPLNIISSVISTDYLCSVPRLKSTGNIFISILLADLVLLNAAWIIYCLLVEKSFLRTPSSMFCEGCMDTRHELQPRRSNVSSMSRVPMLGYDSTLSVKYEPVQSRPNPSDTVWYNGNWIWESFQSR